MFGAVCSGRPIQLASQVSPTKYVLNIPNASNINFITIFLLPNSDFVDANYTALIYFQLPNSEFKLLGGINPNKPSAIYKLNNVGGGPGGQDDDMNIDENTVNLNDATTINIGISIETTPDAEIQLAKEKERVSSTALVTTKGPPAAKNVNETASLANKIVGHAYNYLASFIDDTGKVPIKAFDNWWDKFKTKLANNPNFLEELQQ